MSARQPIAPRLVAWQARAGRHDLPWQQRAQCVSRLGFGDHAAADPGRDRDSVLRTLHGEISRRARARRCGDRRSAASVDRPGVLRAGAQPASRRAADSRSVRRRISARAGRGDVAARHRPFHRGRDTRAVQRRAARHPRRQRQARTVASLRHRRRTRRQRHAGAALETGRGEHSGRRCRRATPRPSWIWAPRCVPAANRAARTVPSPPIAGRDSNNAPANCPPPGVAAPLAGRSMP